MKRILFLCTANAARSQMAEAWVNARPELGYQAFSAGTRASQVAEEAKQVLQQQGLSIEGLHSKQLEHLPHNEFDYVITLCDNARQECPSLPETSASLHWSISDPLHGEPASFEQAFSEISAKLGQFMALNDQQNTQTSPLPTKLFQLLSDTTRLQILMLIEDEQRLSVNQLCIALADIQPKVSRHLALLREAKLVATTRQGQQVFYHLPQQQAPWVAELLQLTRIANPAYIHLPLLRLQQSRQTSQ